MLVLALGDTVAVGVRIVKVAPAGISNRACAAVFTQNWQTTETALAPVMGMAGVTVVVVVTVGLAAAVGVSVAAVVEVGNAVGVGEACCPAQAVVNRTSVSAPNKNKWEIFFIFSAPYLKSFTGVAVHACNKIPSLYYNEQTYQFIPLPQSI